MKRIAAMFLVLLLLLPVTLHADVAWVPPDDFLARHIDECERLPQSDRYYIALCNHHSYRSPMDAVYLKSISKGSELFIEWVYTDKFGHKWGLYGTVSGWVPMDAVTPSYSAKDYLRDHAESIQPYAGEMKYFLPSQEELDAIESYRLNHEGGNGGGGVPAVWQQYKHPSYTVWRYPNSPIDYHNEIWSPNIHPLYTLKDDQGTTWVYAEYAGNSEYTFWVNADDPEKSPVKNASKLPPTVQEEPTYLPVPGTEQLQRIGKISYLAPVFPVIAAVLAVMLFSAVLIVLLQQRKGA